MRLNNKKTKVNFWSPNSRVFSFWPPNFKNFHFGSLTLFSYQIAPSVISVRRPPVKCLVGQLMCYLMWPNLTRYRKEEEKKESRKNNYRESVQLSPSLMFYHLPIFQLKIKIKLNKMKHQKKKMKVRFCCSLDQFLFLPMSDSSLHCNARPLYEQKSWCFHPLKSCESPNTTKQKLVQFT